MLQKKIILMHSNLVANSFVCRLNDDQFDLKCMRCARVLKTEGSVSKL